MFHQQMIISYVQVRTVFSLDFNRYPFDPLTPIGFIVASIIFQFLFVLVLYAVMCVFGILIGCFALGMALSDDIQRKLENANDYYKKYKNHAKLIQQFGVIVFLTMKTREFSISHHRIFLTR